MYRLASLARSEPQSRLVEGQECAIEGELGDYVLVSVPPTISHQAAKVLEDKLQNELKKPVMVLTHNVMFLKATKMTPKEANEILREVEEGMAARAEEAKKQEAEAQKPPPPEAPTPEELATATTSPEEPK